MSQTEEALGQGNAPDAHYLGEFNTASGKKNRRSLLQMIICGLLLN
jgi:hypothetical protein